MKRIIAVMVLWTLGMSAAIRAQDSTISLAAGAKEMKPEDLKARIDSKAKTMIIDVRETEEFKAETIPGAINIPLEKLDSKLSSIPKNTFLVFVCVNGNRSSRAAKLATDAGFQDSTFCPLRLWKNKSYPTVRGSGGPNPV